MVQMPALNTPQFEWGKNQMPMKPQPVPPIFQPETAAKAIFWAAHHNRREVYVCWPSLRAIWANKFIPGLLDRYLAGRGYTGQQDNQPADPARSDNLYHTVGGTDFAAHGRFDSRARHGGAELWATLYRGPIALGVVCVAALACECFRRQRRKERGGEKKVSVARLYGGSRE